MPLRPSSAAAVRRRSCQAGRSATSSGPYHAATCAKGRIRNLLWSATSSAFANTSGVPVEMSTNARTANRR
jgi:hypothetical protein